MNQLNKTYRTLTLFLIVICNIPTFEKALLKPGKRQKNNGQVQTIYMKNVKYKNFHVYNIDIRFIRNTIYPYIYIYIYIIQNSATMNRKVVARERGCGAIIFVYNSVVLDNLLSNVSGHTSELLCEKT